MQDEEPLSVFQLFAGLVSGVVIGIVFTLSFYLGLGSFLRNAHVLFVIPLLNAAALIVLAFIVFKYATDRGFSRGMLISLSLVLILSTICGVSMIRT